MFDNVSFSRLGSAPIWSNLIDRFGWVEMIDEYSPIKPNQCNVSVGTRIKALLINILTDRKALYRVQEFYERHDVELLLGEGFKPESLNDDALGRALDALYAAGPEAVFTSTSLSALKRANVSLDEIHFDTTSLSVYGEYQQNRSLDITYGYSKDHRPDLKQFIFGLGTAKGFPVFASIENGDLSDHKWNTKMIAKFRDIVGSEVAGKSVYIADSAAITKDNLADFHEYNVSFISRLPNTFSLCGKIKDEACKHEERWVSVGQLAEKDDSATYRIQSFHKELYGKRYRFIAVQSSSLDARKEKSIQAELERGRVAWLKDAKEEEDREYACKADAERGLAEWIASHKGYHRVKAMTYPEVTVVKRSTRGRPKKDDEPETKVTYHNLIELEPPTEETIQALRQRESTFVIITNIHDEQRMGNLEVLQAYKRQHEVEGRFRFLKSPYFVGPIYLQNNDRVEAFACVMLMALVLYSWFEYAIRERMAKETEPLILPGKRKSFRPTGVSVLEMFDDIGIAHVQMNGTDQRAIATKIDPQVERILSFLDLDMSIYVGCKKSA